MKSSIIVIANPAAKNSSVGKIARASFLLGEKGFTAETMLTRKRGDAGCFAGEAAARRPYCIIAAGGDGTINEVLNGVAGTDVPVAILPLGTTNVLAKELGVPENIEGAIRVAVSRPPKRVSLGRIEANGSPAVSYFCLMAGIGLDGKAVHDVSAAVKKVSGKAAYVLSGIKNVCHYSPEQLIFRLDGAEYRGYGAIVCKASKYGGHFRVAPDASLEEPFLYTCIFTGRRRRDLVKYAFGIVTGRHLKYNDVLYLRSSEVEIRGRAHIQIDGDYLGISPARVSVEKDIVRLIY